MNNHYFLLIFFFSLPLSAFFSSGVFAQPQQDSKQDVVEISSLVIPNDTFKFLLAPLQSSNRIEYNHYLPLLIDTNFQIFIDNTTYVKQRPIETDNINSSYFDSIGDSLRIGYRKLLTGADSFWGVNFGYDNALQAGLYYQQLGVGFEVTSPNFQLVSTFAAPIGNRAYPSPGKSILSPFNIQVSVPTGINALVFCLGFIIYMITMVLLLPAVNCN